MVDGLIIIDIIFIAAGLTAVFMIAWGREMKKLMSRVPRKINLPQNIVETGENKA